MSNLDIVCLWTGRIVLLGALVCLAFGLIVAAIKWAWGPIPPYGPIGALSETFEHHAALIEARAAKREADERAADRALSYLRVRSEEIPFEGGD